MYVLILTVFVLRRLFFRRVEVLIGLSIHFVIRSDKVLSKVVAIMCRRLKTNDEAVRLEGIEIVDQ